MNDEAGTLIDEAQSPQQRVFFRLGAQAGLRREETASVTTKIGQFRFTDTLRSTEEDGTLGTMPSLWGGATTDRRRERQIVLMFRKVVSCPSRWAFDVIATAVVTDLNTVTDPISYYRF